uniref:Uncharacterized protein n=1 Tax=Caenorhabditis japonica TaxID=281687 RepID=A0A8R1DMK3_CAEJA
MAKFIVYFSLAILAFVSLQVQSAVLPVSSKEVALVETSTPSEGSSTAIDTLGSSRVKRQGECGCCGCVVGCGGGCGCCC